MGTELEEERVRSWGFRHAFTWTDPPGAYYSPHSHTRPTTHLILQGEMTVWFPKEEDPKRKTYGVGSRIDVEAERVHEVIVGKEGCTSVIGE